MITIAITETAEDGYEMAERLRRIADLLDQGFTSGYHPGWSISDADGA